MYWAPFLTRDFRPWNLVPGGQLFWLIFIGFTGWRAQAQWNLEYVAGENRAAQVVSALWSMHWRVILTVRILEMFSHDQQSRHIPSTGGSHHQSVNRRKEKKSIKQTYHGTPTWIDQLSDNKKLRLSSQSLTMNTFKKIVIACFNVVKSSLKAEQGFLRDSSFNKCMSGHRRKGNSFNKETRTKAEYSWNCFNLRAERGAMQGLVALFGSVVFRGSSPLTSCGRQPKGAS